MVADGSKARKLAASEAEVQTPYCGGKSGCEARNRYSKTERTGHSSDRFVNLRLLGSDLATGGRRLARRTRGNGHGEVLTVWGWLKFDGGLSTHAYLALHLGVSVKHKLHGVFGISIAHFDSEGLLVARNVGDFTRG